MNKALEISQKNELISLVRKVYKHFGEIEENFKVDIVEILNKDIEKSLTCFRDLAGQCKWMPKIQKETGVG